MAERHDRRWPIREAKSQLGEVVEQACRQGPQFITRRGKEAAVILSCEDYQDLLRPHDSLAAFFRRSPLAGPDLDLARTTEFGREIDL
ncbi:MAG: type II toxin-antitoxin system Phd/YefM family antitoxin [Thermus sp.]